jgi:hypothetical protein
MYQMSKLRKTSVKKRKANGLSIHPIILFYFIISIDRTNV